MSYDIHLQHFRDGDAVPVEAPHVWRLLEEAWQLPPDEHGYCLVMRDGDEGDLYAPPPGDPIDGLMVNHAGRGIFDLVYDVAVAGDMAIMPPDAGPFIVREEQRPHLPAELRADARIVGSGTELVHAIEDA